MRTRGANKGAEKQKRKLKIVRENEKTTPFVGLEPTTIRKKSDALPTELKGLETNR